MKSKLLALTLVLALCSQGCVFLLLGAAGYGVAKGVGAVTKRRPHLTEMQRRELECKEIEGTRDDVFRSVVTVFEDRGYTIQSSDFQGGIISAGSDKPFLQINATVEEFTKDRIKLRVTIKDKDGVIEDSKVFAKLFDETQAEVFRRTNLSK